MDDVSLLRTKSLNKKYTRGVESLQVLDDVNLSVAKGELVILLGPSGSGKTTLLSMLGGIDVDYDGELFLDGAEIRGLSKTKRVGLRNSVVGMVFQDFRLLPHLNALENVEAPLYLHKIGKKERRERAANALRLVGLEDRQRHRPDQMSGGERQRTAIARALASGAKLLLCDEPTGNLNAEMSFEIFSLLKRVCQEFDKTIVLATHDESAIQFADRVVKLSDGQLQEVA